MKHGLATALALKLGAIGLLSLALVCDGLGAQAAANASAASAATQGGFTEIRWEDLMPKNWDPSQGMPSKNLGPLLDGSPRSLQLMREMRELWDKAPTNSAMNGRAVKLPGYVVPLEESKDGLKEFLLVPYFGACIHTPPPPANQIVHVVAARAVKGFRSMDTVWVSGTLATSRQDSPMGASAYTLEAAVIERYEADARR